MTSFFKHYAEGRDDLTANIEKLNVPVKIFWADEDALLFAENAHHLTNLLPDSSVHIFENCGHFCYQDKSADFAQLMRDWILA